MTRLTPREDRALANDWLDGFTGRELAEKYGIGERSVWRRLEKYKRGHKKKTSDTRPDPQPCGTNAAYQRHRRRREIPCDACVAAHLEDWRSRNPSPGQCLALNARGTQCGHRRRRGHDTCPWHSGFDTIQT